MKVLITAVFSGTFVTGETYELDDATANRLISANLGVQVFPNESSVQSVRTSVKKAK
jgi:hypothetical protein